MRPDRTEQAVATVFLLQKQLYVYERPVWRLFSKKVPGPNRSGNTVVIQHRISDSKQFPFSGNAVEGPVVNQCIGSVGPVYAIIYLQIYRSTDSGETVYCESLASALPVCNQYVRNI